MVRYQWGVVEMTNLNTAANSDGLVGGDTVVDEVCTISEKRVIEGH